MSKPIKRFLDTLDQEWKAVLIYPDGRARLRRLLRQARQDALRLMSWDEVDEVTGRLYFKAWQVQR